MVEGMETIVATVSGYHGSDRLKLVNLIAATGANYVGKMSKSTTHLVCWKFKGDKYELARKLGTLVVNHQWFVDCFKEGKRIQERPYAVQSGQEAGFSDTDLSLVMERAGVLKENKLLLNKPNVLDRLEHVINLDSDEIENDDFDYDWRLDENLNPRPGCIEDRRQRAKRKAVKETSKRDWRVKADSRRSIRDSEIHTIDMLESDESDDFPNYSRVHRRRDNDRGIGCHLRESSHRSRRLVKKNARNDIIDLATSGSELPSRILSDDNQRPIASSHSIGSSKSREKVEASTSRRHETSSCDQGKSRYEASHMNDIAPLAATSTHSDEALEGKGTGKHETEDRVDHFTGPPRSVELSCVICWADFSSIRGILPCGHRFCFKCIKDWADRRALDRKETTCPLCKASFASITRIDGGDALDQKIYSQSIPLASSSQDIFIVPETRATRSNAEVPFPSVCCRCQSTDPADLLIPCQVCQTSCIHSYCLDPPLFPWTCISCRGRRSFYHYC